MLMMLQMMAQMAVAREVDCYNLINLMEATTSG